MWFQSFSRQTILSISQSIHRTYLLKEFSRFFQRQLHAFALDFLPASSSCFALLKRVLLAVLFLAMMMPRFFFFWRNVPPFVWFLLYCRFCYYYYYLLPPFSYYRLFLSLLCFLVFLILLLLFFFTSGVISLPETMILFVAFRFYHVYSSSCPPPPPPSALVHSFFPCRRSSIAQLACVMPVYGLCNLPFLYLWFISSDLLIHHLDQRPLLGSGENWGQSVKLLSTAAADWWNPPPWFQKQNQV